MRVVNASEALATRAGERTNPGKVFPGEPSKLSALLRCLRPHRWINNLIIFVPVLIAHRLGEAAVLTKALLAFAAFCFGASAVYLLNDLLDLEAERHRPTKRGPPSSGGCHCNFVCSTRRFCSSWHWESRCSCPFRSPLCSSAPSSCPRLTPGT